MASKNQPNSAHPGDILLVIHDFVARSPDELNLQRGDRIELSERDDEFNDGWYLGKHLQTGESGLFPVVYTQLAPKSTLSAFPARTSLAPIDPAAPPAYNNVDNQRPPQPATPTKPQTFQSSPQYGVAASPTQGIASEDSTSAGAGDAGIYLSQASANTHRAASTASTRSTSGELRSNNPVLDHTLSVIDEHITDMHSPRNSLVPMSAMRSVDDLSNYGGPVQRRLSTINGDMTDEEDNAFPYTEADVLQWSPDQVAALLHERGVDDHQCQVFRDEEINGEVLMNMEQSSLMLQQFDLGKMGKRLALWHKVFDFQCQVRGQPPRAVSRHGYSASTSSMQDQSRMRSGTNGAVLPRIPSLMDSPRNSIAYGQTRRSMSQQFQQQDATFGASRADTPPQMHSPRPSAASVRDLNHSRRHSSFDYANTPVTRTPNPQQSQPPSTQATHNKHSSFDRGWTMEKGTPTIEEPSPSIDQGSTQEMEDSKDLAPEPTELGMTVVSSLDLERGYFSNNEAENRKARNVLRKKDVDTHIRAPSDSFGNKRLSYVFRNKRVGSTDSIPGPADEDGANDQFYSMPYSSGQRTASSPQMSKVQRSTSPTAPTVTKLDYSSPLSIDAVATSNTANERTSAGSSLQNRFTRARATGLRAISDAITGDEKTELDSKDPVPQIPTPSRDGSSTPSIASRSLEVDDTSLLKEKAGTDSTGKTTPIMPTVPRRKTKKDTSAYLRGLEKKTPKEQMIGCDYSGWMKKKSSNLMTTWKTRLFVLRGRRLSYYYSEDDTEEKGLIDISFHRVLPATNDRITGLHSLVTGAANSPTSPQGASIETTAASDAAKVAAFEKRKSGDSTPSGQFIFKLVPPRAGLSKAVNFTKPTVHYFAVDNVQQGRLWMAALMKATIDRDDASEVITTYNQKTISLAKAKAMRQRPPFLAGDDNDETISEKSSTAPSTRVDGNVHGLNIKFSREDLRENGSLQDGSTINGSMISGSEMKNGVITPGLDTNKSLPAPPMESGSRASDEYRS